MLIVNHLLHLHNYVMKTSLRPVKHITTSTTESHTHQVLMVLNCIEVLTSYGYDCQKILTC